MCCFTNKTINLTNKTYFWGCLVLVMILHRKVKICFHVLTFENFFCLLFLPFWILKSAIFLFPRIWKMSQMYQLIHEFLMLVHFMFTLTLTDKSDAFEVKSSVITGTLAIKFPTLKLEVEDKWNESNLYVTQKSQNFKYFVLFDQARRTIFAKLEPKLTGKFNWILKHPSKISIEKSQTFSVPTNGKFCNSWWFSGF